MEIEKKNGKWPYSEADNGPEIEQEMNQTSSINSKFDFIDLSTKFNQIDQNSIYFQSWGI